MFKRFITGIFAAAILCAFTMPAFAMQDDAEGKMFFVYYLKAKSGKENAVYAGLKAHAEFHQQGNDPWTWFAMKIITGKYTDSFMIRSQDLNWGDNDTHKAPGDIEHWNSHVKPHLESEVGMIMVPDSSISRTPPSEDYYKMISITRVGIRPGKSQDFFAALTKWHEALVTENVDFYYAIARVQYGGDGEEVVFVSFDKSWAGLQEDETGFAALIKVYGQEEAQKIGQQFFDSSWFKGSDLAEVLPELTMAKAEK